MADKHILHMVTPLKHMSPFDVNMALDAGYDTVLPYTSVTLDEITGLVQDAIFSRPPKVGARTAMFIAALGAAALLVRAVDGFWRRERWPLTFDDRPGTGTQRLGLFAHVAVQD